MYVYEFLAMVTKAVVAMVAIFFPQYQLTLKEYS